MIKVLLFAHLQEEIGQAEVEWDREAATVQEIKEWIAGTYQIKAIEKVMVAVDENYAVDETIVHSGSTVALIPPVSGG